MAMPPRTERATIHAMPTKQEMSQKQTVTRLEQRGCASPPLQVVNTAASSRFGIRTPANHPQIIDDLEAMFIATRFRPFEARTSRGCDPCTKLSPLGVLGLPHHFRHLS